MLSFLELARAFMNTVIYDEREYSYISDMADRPVIEKKRIDPLQATYLYYSLLFSISLLVSLATSRALPISTDLVFAVLSTSMRGTLSTRGISVSLESSLSRVSSRPLRVALFSEVSIISFFLASSSSGLSY